LAKLIIHNLILVLRKVTFALGINRPKVIPLKQGLRFPRLTANAARVKNY